MQHTEQASCAHNHARTYDPDPQAVGSRGVPEVVWVPESRSWVLSCELVEEAMGPR